MAIYRKIHTSFWNDPYIESLTPEKKYFYLYLLSNEKTRQCGIYEISIRQMSFDTGYNSETVEKLVSNFQEDGKIMFSKTTNEIAIKNWRKHNDDASPKVKACINKELMLVKSKELRMYLGYGDPQGSRFNPNYRVSDTVRAQVFAEGGNKCDKCKTSENLQIDHIIPRSIGGTSIIENLRPLCGSCNSSRPIVGNELKEEVLSSGYDYDELCKKMTIVPYAYSMRRESQEEQEQEQKEEQTPQDDLFEIFWDSYDKKIDKVKCLSKWSKLKTEERKKIITHVALYILSTPDKSYRKNPETYLNKRSWENEIIQKQDIKIIQPITTYTAPKQATK